MQFVGDLCANFLQPDFIPCQLRYDQNACVDTELHVHAQCTYVFDCGNILSSLRSCIADRFQLNTPEKSGPVLL